MVIHLFLVVIYLQADEEPAIDAQHSVHCVAQNVKQRSRSLDLASAGLAPHKPAHCPTSCFIQHHRVRMNPDLAYFLVLSHLRNKLTNFHTVLQHLHDVNSPSFLDGDNSRIKVVLSISWSNVFQSYT